MTARPETAAGASGRRKWADFWHGLRTGFGYSPAVIVLVAIGITVTGPPKIQEDNLTVRALQPTVWLTAPGESPIVLAGQSSIGPQTLIETDGGGIARLDVVLPGSASPVPSICRLNSDTAVTVLPNGLDDNIVLGLSRGTVICVNGAVSEWKQFLREAPYHEICPK